MSWLAMSVSMVTMIMVVALLSLLVVSPAVGQKRYYITRHGACSDCDYHGKSYQWCSLGTGSGDWDYCSTKPGMSSRDKACRSDHPCGHHGEKYLWCYLKEGSWDYCSLIEDSSVTYETKDQEKCQNYCDIESNGYYYCRKLNNREEKCSPLNEITALGVPCKRTIADTDVKNGLCGHHGYKYQWCYQPSSWDVCSNPTFKNLQYFGDLPPASTSATQQASSFCKFTLIQTTTQVLSAESKLVTFLGHEEPQSSVLCPLVELTESQRADAYKVIRDWHAQHDSKKLFLSGQGTIQEGTHMRLDRQARFDTSGVKFLNLTVTQINRHRGRPLFVGQVKIQTPLDGIEARGFRRLLATGLRISLRQGAPVWIMQEKFGTVPSIDRGLSDWPTTVSLSQRATRIVCEARGKVNPAVERTDNSTWHRFSSAGSGNPILCKRNQDPSSSANVNKTKRLNRRIFDGTPLDGGDTPPFMVALVFIINGRAELICGGSLIDQKRVLTAAHCIQPLIDRLKCGFGIQAWIWVNDLDNFSGLKVDLFDYKIHPSYNPQPGRATFQDFDVAIIELDPAFSMQIPISICIGMNPDYSDRDVYLVGFGRYDCYNPSRKLLGAQGKVYENGRCNLNIVNHGSVAQRLSNHQVCAGLKNLQSPGQFAELAKGDSGGPLFIYNGAGRTVLQVGIVSYYIAKHVTDPCPNPNYPGVYMKAGAAAAFIQANAPGTQFC